MRTLEEHISGLNKLVQTVLPANFEEYSSGLKEHLVTFQEYDMSPPRFRYRADGSCCGITAEMYRK